MASSEAPAKTYYLACHCQANILSLTVPITPSPTPGDLGAPVGADADTEVRHDVEADTEKAEAEAEAGGKAKASEGGQWDKARTVTLNRTTGDSGDEAVDGLSSGGGISKAPHSGPGAGASTGAGTWAGLDGAMICDCSICLKRLSVFSIQPVERVRFIKGCGVEGGGGKGEVGGEEEGGGTLKVYRFGEKKGSHCYCGKCGTHIFARFEGYESHIGLNLRAVREPRLCVYDLSPPPVPSHMASVPPLYHFPTLPSEAMAYLQKRQTHYPYPTEVYTGSCHCKRVTFGVVGKPMAEERRGVCMCSCSICHGNGTIWMYPGVGDIYFLPPTPSTDTPSASAPSPASSSSSSSFTSTPHIPHPSLITRYTFTPGPDANQHVFCTTCGVQVIETSGSADVLAAGCADDKGYRDSADNIHCQLGVNIACLNKAGEWLSDGKGEGLGLEVDREFDEREPLYRLRL